jgi:hypothetical protein
MIRDWDMYLLFVDSVLPSDILPCSQAPYMDIHTPFLARIYLTLDCVWNAGSAVSRLLAVLTYISCFFTSLICLHCRNTCSNACCFITKSYKIFHNPINLWPIVHIAFLLQLLPSYLLCTNHFIFPLFLPILYLRIDLSPTYAFGHDINTAYAFGA